MSQQPTGFKHAKLCMLVLLSLILGACGGGSSETAANSEGGDDGLTTQPASTPATAAATTSTPAVATGNDFTCGIPNFQAEFLALVNSARAKGAVCGERTMKPSRPLGWSGSLGLASSIHSEDMAVNDFFSHDSPRTGTLRERIHGTGYQYEEAGENLAGGQTTIAKAVNDWLKSPSHCANMLNPNFLEMGAACKNGSKTYYKTYWTLEMALPLGAPRDDGEDDDDDGKDDEKKD
jgi:uncharacterized protein YkwD